jgi:L-amino acid N-acyltransferase YncA
MIRDATLADAARIAEVYNHYILNTVVSFEEVPLTSEDVTGRIEAVTCNSYPWLVLEQEQTLVGYAYANRWQQRAAYRHSVEVSVYLSHQHLGKGLGLRLYDELFRRLATLDLHVAVAGIALPNEASVAFHEKIGFRKVAHYQEVGYKFNQWLDVGYWQKFLTPTTHDA